MEFYSVRLAVEAIVSSAFDNLTQLIFQIFNPFIDLRDRGFRLLFFLGLNNFLVGRRNTFPLFDLSTYIVLAMLDSVLVG